LLLMRPWASNLGYTTFLFLYFGICRPIYLISIEFQNIDNNLGTPPNYFFFHYSLPLIISHLLISHLDYIIENLETDLCS
jgi:hypothetical protein